MHTCHVRALSRPTSRVCLLMHRTGALYHILLSPPSVLFLSQVVDPSCMCGDWPRDDIYSRWPVPVADELATFVWPIDNVDELDRLFACDHAQPVSICGGEFTAACRAENERQHKEVTLSVDLRISLVPGVMRASTCGWFSTANGGIVRTSFRRALTRRSATPSAATGSYG